jgi:hypothetical protein
MGLFKTAAKAGVAKKVFTEARKPKNQRKLKQLWSKATGKRTSGRRRRR